ncbi:MAG: zinc ribbon domain-containing protein [Candidatus Methanospirareceae archaeon]
MDYEYQVKNMEPKMPEGFLCQSCGMPMRTEEDFGINKDGSKNKDYCHFCFQNGKFTDEGITLEQKIEKNVQIAVKMAWPEHNARAMANNTIPKLKRWQTK